MTTPFITGAKQRIYLNFQTNVTDWTRVLTYILLIFFLLSFFMWAYLDFVVIYFIFYFIRQVGLVFYARLRFCVGAAHSLIISTESLVS